MVAANSLRNLGDKRIQMVGIDHDEVVLKAIKDGFVHGTMLQNPYGQAYIGSYALDRLRAGCTVKADAPWIKTPQTAHFIDRGTAFVEYADKVDGYKEAMKTVTKDISGHVQGQVPGLQELRTTPPTANSWSRGGSA